MPSFSLGRGGHCHQPVPIRDFPFREIIPLPGRLTSFLVLVPEPEGQLDVPKPCHSLGLARSSCRGCREPLLCWSTEDTPAAKSQRFLSFPCGFYPGLGCQSSSPRSAGKWGEAWLPVGALVR